MRIASQNRKRLRLRVIIAAGAVLAVCACAAGAAGLFRAAGKPAGAAPTPLVSPPQRATAAPQPAATPKDTPPASPSPSAAPTPSPLEGRRALPEGILPPEQAAALARAAYLNFFGVDTGECPAVDTFSYSQPVLLGSGKPIAPETYDKIPCLSVGFSDYTQEGAVDAHDKRKPDYPYIWYFTFCEQPGPSAVWIQIDLNAVTGEAVGGVLGLGPDNMEYSEKEFKEKAELAAQFVKEKIAGKAGVVETARLNMGSDVSVALSDGRTVEVNLDRQLRVVRFWVKLSENGLPLV